jgi:endonuclease/exonuclease/phosphatase family metal-dependent hydrolase
LGKGGGGVRKNLVAVLIIALIFSLIGLIPRGFSQWNIKLDYLVDESGKSIELNLTAPAYITSVPLEAFDAEGNPILQREIGDYFTKRAENTRFNRFILNLPLPENMPVRVVLFPGTAMERSFVLTNPDIRIDTGEGRARAYLKKDSSIGLSVVNGELNAEFSLIAAQDGWHSIDLGSLPEQLKKTGTAMYFTITFPGGLSTTVTRYVPQVFVDAGIGYTKIKGMGISGKAPRIDVYNSGGTLRSTTGKAVQYKEGEFLFQKSFEGRGKEIRDGDRLLYEEEGYSFGFDIPYFFADYDAKDNTITGTVSRKGRVVFRVGSQHLEAEPDDRGRFKIPLTESIDKAKLINVRGGYISPAGNEYWKMFDWGHLIKATPLYRSSQFDIKVMSYNIHHGISRSGKLDVDSIAEVIKESSAHIVGLQEVDSRFVRSFFRDQAKELAEKLDMYYYFGENFTLLGAGYGNAVLSKFPIVSASNLQLNGKGEQRGVVSARVDIYGKEIDFLVTHLSLNRAIRDTQLQQIRRYIQLLEGEVILVGDFNSTHEAGEIMYIERELREAVKEMGRDELYTFVGRNGTKERIDYVFLSPEITVSDVYTIDSDASDHLPLVADIGIKDI